MCKLFIATIAGVALIAYALLVACSRLGDKEEYEAYERWKKEHDEQIHRW